jgi:hypothetical protein
MRQASVPAQPDLVQQVLDCFERLAVFADKNAAAVTVDGEKDFIIFEVHAYGSCRLYACYDMFKYCLQVFYGLAVQVFRSAADAGCADFCFFAREKRHEHTGALFYDLYVELFRSGIKLFAG